MKFLKIMILAIISTSALVAQAMPKDIRLDVASFACRAKDDSGVTVQYNHDAQIVTVSRQNRSAAYEVVHLLPGLGQAFFISGYAQGRGYLQLNVIPGKTTMLLEGDGVVTYLSCEL